MFRITNRPCVLSPTRKRRINTGVLRFWNLLVKGMRGENGGIQPSTKVLVLQGHNCKTSPCALLAPGSEHKYTFNPKRESGIAAAGSSTETASSPPPGRHPQSIRKVDPTLHFQSIGCHSVVSSLSNATNKCASPILQPMALRTTLTRN